MEDKMASGNVEVSIKMSPKKAGRMYMKNIQLEKEIKELKRSATTRKIEMAEQQILGFHCASVDEPWDVFIKAMGLTMDEYNQLEDEGMIDYLSDEEKSYILDAVDR